MVWRMRFFHALLPQPITWMVAGLVVATQTSHLPDCSEVVGEFFKESPELSI